MAAFFTVSCNDTVDEGTASSIDPGPDAGALDRGIRPDAGQTDVGDAGPEGCENGPSSEAGLVATSLGLVRGRQANGVWSYLGLPYAAPPVGDLRWRPPEPAACYDGVLEAAAPGAECPQYGTSGGRPLVGDEDCLTLNVWTPVGTSDGAPRPVLFFVHGGGHEQGGSARPIYGGAPLARNYDAVVVSANYRLGPFGFLTHEALDGPAGNYGMADQIAALSWVKDNIQAFGGDPKQVLVFGQSAGSASVCRLLAAPLARGLFQAAALMSGGCGASPLETALATGRAFATRVGCGEAEDVARCLRNLSQEEIMSGFDPLASGTNVVGRGTWGGVIDGTLLTDNPYRLIERGAHAQVPVIVGSTREENGRGAPNLQTEAQYQAAVRALYGAVAGDAVLSAMLAAYPAADYPSPRDAYVALTSDARFTCPARRVARALSANQAAPVYRYLFAHVAGNAAPATQALGAWHGIDLFYVFDTIETTGLSKTQEDQDIVDALQRAWRGLASTLEIPTNAIRPAWPRYAAGSDERLLLIENRVRVVSDPKQAQCDFWDTVVP